MRTQPSLKGRIESQLYPQIRDKVSSWLGQVQGVGRDRIHQHWVKSSWGWIRIWVLMDVLRLIQTLSLRSMCSRERERDNADLLRNCASLWMLMTKVLKQEKGMLLFLIPQWAVLHSTNDTPDSAAGTHHKLWFQWTNLQMLVRKSERSCCFPLCCFVTGIQYHSIFKSQVRLTKSYPEM